MSIETWANWQSEGISERKGKVREGRVGGGENVEGPKVVAARRKRTRRIGKASEERWVYIPTIIHDRFKSATVTRDFGDGVQRKTARRQHGCDCCERGTHRWYGIMRKLDQETQSATTEKPHCSPQRRLHDLGLYGSIACENARQDGFAGGVWARSSLGSMSSNSICGISTMNGTHSPSTTSPAALDFNQDFDLQEGEEMRDERHDGGGVAVFPVEPGLIEPPSIPPSLDGLPAAVYLDAALRY
ncbi:hypothetical protein B0H13DRAFT_1886280 [Mycena leptocephala]|nr:hypothetical protein B0H13DRAFT_1886280 [Mycena leptocephala]